ncbi:MAG: sugar ABC transporter substrate-binding protein [Candidatus Methanomethylicaceae archaeon]
MKKAITKIKAIAILVIVIVAIVAGVAIYFITKPPEIIKLRFAMFGAPPEISVYKDMLIPAFEKKYPNIKVELEIYPHEEYLSKMMADFAAGTLPDVMKQMDVEILSMVKGGLFRPLDEFIEDREIGINKGDFFPACWKLPGLVYEGKTYGIPIDFLTFALYYNPELFKKAGLDPDKPPRNWDEIFSYSQALAKVTKYGFSIPGWDMPWFNFLYQAGGTVWEWSNGKAIGPAFNKDPGVRSLSFLADMIHKYKIAYPNIWGETPPLTLLAKGELAMLIDGPWQIAAIKMDFPEFVGTFRTAPLPVGPAGPGNCLFGSAFGVGATTKHPREAWLLVKEITSEENQRNWAIKTGISPPSRKTVFDELIRTEPRFEAFVITPEEARTEFYIEKFPAFRDIITPELQSVYNPKIMKDPKKALDDAASRAIKEIFGG